MGVLMDQQKQEIDTFAAILMEQRNSALTEAAYWRAQAIKAQSRVMELEAAEQKKDEGEKEAKKPS
jgi:hypothetical protein